MHPVAIHPSVVCCRLFQTGTGGQVKSKLRFTMNKLTKSLLSLFAVAGCICVPAIGHASMTIQSVSGPVTQTEIDSFKTYMATQTPPPTPWGALNGTGHNAWCDGSGGNGLEAFGMMYEASGDVTILNSMISWADTLVSERNDLMSAANGGQRVCWDGIIDHIWVASDLATANPSTGCETGDAGGHLSYCALLILQTPSLWNTTVPDGDPFGYGTTYLDRAKTYLQRCDEQNDQYVLKYFVQSGTDLIRDPTNSAWTGLSTPINRQSMFFRGFAREAACHVILGDAPSRVATYNAIVNAAGNECLNGMVIHSYTAKSQTVYKWYYYPWDTTHIENSGHAQYDLHGLFAVWVATGNPAAFTRSLVNPIGNTVVDVMNLGVNSFSGNVDGTGTAQNYLEEGMLKSADWNSSVYDVVAAADVASGRYATSPSMDATILWMKNRRYQEFSVAATPASQNVNAGSGTSYTVTLAPLGAFAGAVNLTVSGLPSGVTGNFSPSSINLATVSAATTTATLSISTSSSTSGGTYTLTITGTSGSVAHSATVTLVVAPAADFSISATPTSQTVTAGNSTSYTVYLGNINAFTGTISLTAGGLPSGASATFNPQSLTAPGSSTMTVNTTTGTTLGTSTVKITGTSGSLAHSTNVTLIVNSASTNNFAGIYKIQNVASSLVLNNQGSLTNGSAITQWSSTTTSSNLDWTFIATSGGYYQINSCKSGLDAVVQSASTASGAKIIQWSFGSSGDDQWKPVANGDGTYTFYNLHSGLVLADPGGSTSNSTQMDQETANGGSNQKWNLLKQ